MNQISTLNNHTIETGKTKKLSTKKRTIDTKEKITNILNIEPDIDNFSNFYNDIFILLNNCLKDNIILKSYTLPNIKFSKIQNSPIKYNKGNNITINIKQLSLFINEYGLNKIGLLSIFLHEIGHSIFAHFFKNRFKKYLLSSFKKNGTNILELKEESFCDQFSGLIIKNFFDSGLVNEEDIITLQNLFFKLGEDGNKKTHGSGEQRKTSFSTGIENKLSDGLNLLISSIE